MIETQPQLNETACEVQRSIPEGTPIALGTSQSLWSSWGREFAVVIVLAGVLPLLEAAKYHTLGQPMNDDWSYLNALAHLTQHGAIDFNHWASVFDLGQLILTSPLYLIFGVHPALAMLWVWIVGMAGIFGVTYLSRRCGVPRNLSLVLTTALSVCPLFMHLDVSFMTDVPMFTLMVLSLCLWIDCKDRSTYEWRRWAALGLATIAFTIREPGALVAIPVLLEPLVNTRRRDRVRKRQLLAIGAGWAVVICGLWFWRQHFQSGGSPPVHLSVTPLLSDWFSGWLPSMLGLFMLPSLLVVKPWTLVPKLIRSGLRSAWLVGTTVVVLPSLVVLVLAAYAPRQVQLGNSVVTDSAIPLTFRVPLVLLGLLSLAACVIVVWGSRRPRAMYEPLDRRADWGLLSVIIAYTGFLLACRLVGLADWDRYWLIDVALGSVVLLRAGRPVADADLNTVPRPHRNWVAWGAVSLIAVLGVTIFSDTAAYSSGEWAFAQVSASHLPVGYTARDISAGWIWDGYVYTDDSSTYRDRPSTVNGYYKLEAGDRSGSFYFIGRGSKPANNVGTCAPWMVEGVRDGDALPANAVAVGPVSQGLFESVRFVLVRQPIKGCVKAGDRYTLDVK